MVQYVLALVTFVTAVLAHGHVQGLVANGKYYMGYTPNFQYMNPKPKVPAWSAGGYGQGAITPDRFGSADIVCHEKARPGEAYAETTAGSTVQIQWTAWADSHHGPIVDYLAECQDCLSVSPTSLRFTKIQEGGLIQPSAQGKYVFASDYLIKHNNTWEVKIPKNLKSGNYVLRTEIIALHAAGTPGGAQNYPQCFNLKIVGDGHVKLPAGIPATSFYKRESPGIVFNLYGKFDSYPIPGPAVWNGAN